ncbi:MAG: tRNA (guanosine(37)-N1)-methyltransferase TrmD [Coprococcus sp.]
MDFHVMTLFPDMIMQGLSDSVIGRAVRKGTIGLHPVNIRDYSLDKHKHVDDYPYGGGAGMVMQPEPIYACYQDIVGKMDKKPRVIYMTPQGRVFSQEIAEELSKEESLIFLCGHYEGIDERVLDEIVTDHLSIGDYVLTGGELPAMVMIDTIARLVPGVLNNSESAEYDSFQDGLLEYPQYTRPEIWHDKQVPEVLLSGHHGNIEKWRRQQSLKRTFERRPELLEQEEVQDDFDEEGQRISVRAGKILRIHCENFEESKKIVKMTCISVNPMIKCNALVRKRITAVAL